MTPIKDIIWCGNVVAVRDFANHIGTWMTTTSEEQAEWIAGSIARAHGVQAIKVDALPTMRYALESTDVY